MRMITRSSLNRVTISYNINYRVKYLVTSKRKLHVKLMINTLKALYIEDASYVIPLITKYLGAWV